MSATLCAWCGKPVDTGHNGDSFVRLSAGTILHTNNARPSCCASYDAHLRDEVNRPCPTRR